MINASLYYVNPVEGEDMATHLHRVADIVKELDTGADVLHLPVAVSHVTVVIVDGVGWGTMLVLE